MPEKLYTIRFKPPETSTQPVEAARHEVADGYLVLLKQDGSLAALFDMEFVESWTIEDLPE